MLIRMAIADSDTDYVERLANVLETYDNVSLAIYTDQESLKSALEYKGYDVILFAPDFSECLALLDKSTAAIMFYEEGNVPEALKHVAKVRRYQRISSLFQQILEFYAELCKEGPEGVLGQRQAAAIAFYSPAGGVGKTTAALVCAVKLAEQGYRTLYLNMEDMAAEDCYLPQDQTKGMSDVLAALGREVNFSLKVKSLLKNKAEKLYYLNHFSSPGDLEEMTAGEMKELLKALGSSGLFDWMIVDMGVAMPNKLMALFDMVHKIVLVEKADAIAARKMERFLSQSHILSEYEAKMLRLKNFETGRGIAADTKIPCIGTLPYVKNPDSGQIIDILAESPGAQFVDRLFSGR